MEQINRSALLFIRELIAGGIAFAPETWTRRLNAMLNRSSPLGVVPLNLFGEYLETSQSRQPHGPFPAGASRPWQKPTHRHFIFDTGYHTALHRYTRWNDVARHGR
jgi:hypothetical protein